jgi:hypothetical protein
MNGAWDGQLRIDSLMEAVTNTAIGFVISMVTWQVIVAAFNLPTSVGDDLLIVGIFTVISILRQYVLRRLFDGRSPWCALRARFSRRSPQI